MSKEDMVKEAVEEAKAKAEAEETNATTAEAEEAAEAEAKEDAEDTAEAGEETGSEEDQGEEKSGEKKKFFGKKNKKDKKDEKIEELNDRITRQMAEFDNFRKRSEKILPVVDNFERGLDSIPEEEKGSPFAEGMEKIYKQLMTTLDSLGVKPIKAVGQEFNPDFHNAVMHVEDEEFGENVVAEEFQKGYMYRESVVRHSMVKVAN